MFTLLLLSPLGKGFVLHLCNSESPLPEDDLCQHSWPSSSGEEVENVKSLTDGQRAIRKAHLSFQLR
jgi:hypothetical protein